MKLEIGHDVKAHFIKSPLIIATTITDFILNLSMNFSKLRGYAEKFILNTFCLLISKYYLSSLLESKLSESWNWVSSTVL